MSTGTRDTTTFRIASGVRYRRESFGGLIFRRPVAVIYGLTHTGYRALELCDGRRDVEAIAARMAGEYGVDRDAVRADLDRFFDDLRVRGYLETAAYPEVLTG
jgi:hypothetical protein